MDVLDEELEVIRVIFIEELVEERSENDQHILTVHLRPETGDDVEGQFVYLEMKLTINSLTYPKSVPVISFLKWRGLSDGHLQCVHKELSDLTSQKHGSPMLFDILTFIREQLTKYNMPYEDCAICQSPFKESGKDFVRTDCFHYFHHICLSRWLKYVLEQQECMKKEALERRIQLNERDVPQLECPVCRKILPQADTWLKSQDSFQQDQGMRQEEELKFEVDAKLKKWQQKMATLKSYQESKGGIIDVEKERESLLIDSNWIR